RQSVAVRSCAACRRAAQSQRIRVRTATEFVDRTSQGRLQHLAWGRRGAIPCPILQRRCPARLCGHAGPIPAHARFRCRFPSQAGAPVVTRRRDYREQRIAYLLPPLALPSRLQERSTISPFHVAFPVVARAASLWARWILPFFREL